ncbi:hypothetical protein D3C87_1779370 [compost metagenome]
MQEGGQGIARGRDAALHQDSPDGPPVITTVSHQMQQHLFTAHLPLVPIHKVEREPGLSIFWAKARNVIQIPGIQCADDSAQRCQGRRLRGIGGTEAVGLPKQIALEDGIDHMDMVEDAQGTVVRFPILQWVQGGD